MTNLVGRVDREPTGIAGPRTSGDASSIAVLVGLAAVTFSAVYLVSDLLELVHGGFSTSQPVLTYAAEADGQHSEPAGRCPDSLSRRP